MAISAARIRPGVPNHLDCPLKLRATPLAVRRGSVIRRGNCRRRPYLTCGAAGSKSGTARDRFGLRVPRLTASPHTLRTTPFATRRGSKIHSPLIAEAPPPTARRDCPLLMPPMPFVGCVVVTPCRAGIPSGVCPRSVVPRRLMALLLRRRADRSWRFPVRVGRPAWRRGKTTSHAL